MATDHDLYQDTLIFFPYPNVFLNSLGYFKYYRWCIGCYMISFFVSIFVDFNHIYNDHT